MTAEELVEELRMKLGESISEGQTEADTLFTDAQLTKWVNNSSSLAAAAATGWEAKMAHFANLVNVTDGAASREMSDLMVNARLMVRLYSEQAEGPRLGRTRIGKIVRP